MLSEDKSAAGAESEPESESGDASGAGAASAEARSAMNASIRALKECGVKTIAGF
jgi:hypothetical protein